MPQTVPDNTPSLKLTKIFNQINQNGNKEADIFR